MPCCPSFLAALLSVHHCTPSCPAASPSCPAALGDCGAWATLSLMPAALLPCCPAASGAVAQGPLSHSCLLPCCPAAPPRSCGSGATSCGPASSSSSWWRTTPSPSCCSFSRLTSWWRTTGQEGGGGRGGRGGQAGRRGAVVCIGGCSSERGGCRPAGRGAGGLS